MIFIVWIRENCVEFHLNNSWLLYDFPLRKSETKIRMCFFFVALSRKRLFPLDNSQFIKQSAFEKHHINISIYLFFKNHLFKWL